MAIDSYNNGFVVGYFEYNCDFDPGPDWDFHFYCKDYDTYLSEFDPNDNYLGVHHWCSDSSTQYPSCLAINNSNSIYIAGRFSGILDFDPSPGGLFTLISLYNDDAYLLKMTY
jgi:hypothetical protein